MYLEVGPSSNARIGAQFYYDGTATDGVGLAVGRKNIVSAPANDPVAATFVDDTPNDGNIVVTMRSRWLDGSKGILYLSEGGNTPTVSWYVGYWTGATYRKITGSGSVSTVVKDVNNKDVMLMAPEAPENLFMDLGVDQLTNGKAIVQLDPNLSKNITVDDKHPLRVFITIEEGWKQCGAYGVTEKNKDHFVVETEKPCNASFTYMVVANRADEYVPGKGWARYSEERWPVFDPPPTKAKLRYPESKNDE